MKQEIQSAQPIAPEDILDVSELAARLKVRRSWVFEQTRKRAKKRSQNPLPCHKMGKLLRFSWIEVSRWLMQNKG